MMNSQAKTDEASNNEIDTMTTVPNESTTIDKPDESSNKTDDVEMEDVKKESRSSRFEELEKKHQERMKYFNTSITDMRKNLEEKRQSDAGKKLKYDQAMEKLKALEAEKTTLLVQNAYLKGRNEVLENRKCWPFGCCWWR